MSDRITIVSVPGMSFQAHSKTRDGAIEEFIRMARHQKEEAEKWLAIPHDEFHVFRCNGPYAMRNCVDLPPQSAATNHDAQDAGEGR